ENSSWDETLLVVTADHETGYLGGAEDDPGFTEMYGDQGELPTVGWSSGNHTNHLVPYFFKGAGSDAIMNSTVGEDDVRGSYIDNTPLRTCSKTSSGLKTTAPKNHLLKATSQLKPKSKASVTTMAAKTLIQAPWSSQFLMVPLLWATSAMLVTVCV